MKILISLFISVCMLMPATVYASASVSSVMQENVQKKKKDKSKKAVAEVTYEVHLHCQDCVNKVTENLAFLKGVKDLEVSLEKQMVWIEYDPSKTEEMKFRSTLKELGYEVTPAKEEK